MILYSSVQFGMPAQWHHEFTASLTLLAALGHKSTQSEARLKKKSVSFKLSKIFSGIVKKTGLRDAKLAALFRLYSCSLSNV